MKSRRLQKHLAKAKEGPVDAILLGLLGLFAFVSVVSVGVVFAGGVWYFRPWSFVALPVISFLFGKYGDNGGHL
jgi:hypothetical protein